MFETAAPLWRRFISKSEGGAKRQKKKGIYIPNTPLFSKITTIFHIFLVLHRISLHNLCVAVTEHYEKCNATL